MSEKLIIRILDASLQSAGGEQRLGERNGDVRRRGLVRIIGAVAGLSAAIFIGIDVSDRLNGLECSSDTTTVGIDDTLWGTVNDFANQMDVPTGELVYKVKDLNPELEGNFGRLYNGQPIEVPIDCDY